VNNTGTVTIGEGVRAEFDKSNATFVNSGVIQLNGGGAILDVTGFGSSIVLNQAGGTIQGNGEFEILNGLGTLDSTAANTSFIPGLSPGELTIDADLLSGPGTVFSFELAGTTPIVDHDVLSITGEWSLDSSSITMTSINGFTPSAADIFVVATAATITGSGFGNLDGGSRIETTDGLGSFLVTISGGLVRLSEFMAGPPPDTENPVISCPPGLSVPNDPGQCGATVTFALPIATDNQPGVTVACAPASGSFFPVGLDVVTCTATDTSGNTAECSFTITVNDTEAPLVTALADVMVECNTLGGATGVVLGTASAIDNCDASPAITNNAPEFFPAGTTTVTWTATDSSLNEGTAVQTITVVDTTPPSVVCPSPIELDAESPAGAVVAFNVTASDLCDGDLTGNVTCVPLGSGGMFPVGTTTVT
jgi:hypothetical protein